MKKYWEDYEKTQYESIGMKFDAVKSVEARYIKQTEPKDQGNELIEALIPLKIDLDSFEQFEKQPVVLKSERKLPAAQRALAVLRLDDYRIAREFTCILDKEIEIALRRCYRARKKFNLDKLQILNDTGKYFSDCEYNKIEGQKTQGFTLFGISGGGKTTALSSALYNYPQKIIHTTANSRCIQIVYIKVECPADGSLKSFYDRCLDALEDASDCIIPAKKSAKSVGDKEILFKKLALRWNLGMIIIEEIQQLSIKREDTMNQFLTLANDTLIPIVYVGTYKALNRIFGIDFRLARRLGHEIEVKRFDKDALWDDMIEELWEFQWLKEYIPLTEELSIVFYTETAGIIDRVITLFEALQLEAISQEMETKEEITPDFIRKVSETYFGTTRKVLNDLSGGKLKDISEWDDLYNRTDERDLIRAVSNKMAEEKARQVILSTERREGKFVKNILRNNVIDNIHMFLGETYNNALILQAYEYVAKRNRKLIEDRNEVAINAKVIELVIHPEQMQKKEQVDKVVDKYILPILDDIV